MSFTLQIVENIYENEILVFESFFSFLKNSVTLSFIQSFPIHLVIQSIFVLSSSFFYFFPFVLKYTGKEKRKYNNPRLKELMRRWIPSFTHTFY